MPRVSIRTGFRTPEGEEEVLTQYLCDWPECTNVAVKQLGAIAELRLMAMVCEEHIPQRDRPHHEPHATS